MTDIEGEIDHINYSTENVFDMILAEIVIPLCHKHGFNFQGNDGHSCWNFNRNIIVDGEVTEDLEIYGENNPDEYPESLSIKDLKEFKRAIMIMESYIATKKIGNMIESYEFQTQ